LSLSVLIGGCAHSVIHQLPLPVVCEVGKLG